MSKLLILGCTARKLEGMVPAGHLYIGRQFDLVRLHRAELEAAGWTLGILSAKYGLVSWDRHIQDYDEKLTPTSAKHWSLRLLGWPNQDDLEEIAVYGGKLYRETIQAGFEGVPVTELVGEGRGCGDHYSALKRFITNRGE